MAKHSIEYLLKSVIEADYLKERNIDTIIHKIYIGNYRKGVDREKEYWYLEYQKNNGLLYYCDKFFRNFFLLFSIECNEYKNIIKDFVEMVLTFEVKNIYIRYYQSITELNDVLNETSNLESIKINLTR